MEIDRKERNHIHHEMSSKNRVLITVLTNFVITIVEIVGGILSGSLLLLSDSLHNLTDTFSSVVTYFTLRLSEREVNEKFTFGYKRAEIVSAFVNSSLLLVIAVLLIREAISKFFNVTVVDLKIMLPVSVIGLIANGISVLLLHRHTDSLNIKSAYLHLLSDALSSVAVVVGAIFMWAFKIYFLDPLLTVVVAVYMGFEAWEIFKRSLFILMESKPEDINLDEIRDALLKIDGVKNIHHVHVWMLSDADVLMEAHVNIDDISISNTTKIREEIERVLLKQFGINHVTIQFECNEHLDEELIKKTHH